MAGEQGQQQQQSQQQGQAQDPWRQQLPESLRDKPVEEIVKWGNSAHTQLGSLDKDLGTYKKRIGDLESESKRYQDAATQYQQGTNEWAKWYKDGVEPHWGEFEKWRSSRGTGQQQQQQQFSGDLGGDEAYKDWETKSPSEQARTLAGIAAKQAEQRVQEMQEQYGQSWKQYQQGVKEYIADRERYIGTYLQIWQRAMAAKQQNPNLDIDKAVQEGIRAMSGQYDPLDLGIKLSTMDQTYDEKLKAQKALWVEEQKAEAEKNKIVTPPAGTMPPVTRTRMASAMTNAGARENAAKQLIEKYGAGIF